MAEPPQCRRCKGPNALFQLRNLPTCRDCFVDYVESKAVKRFGTLQQETRVSSKPEPRRYVAGLSFGPSSSVLAQLLDHSARYHAARKGSSPFEPLVVHVDTDLSPAAAASARVGGCEGKEQEKEEEEVKEKEETTQTPAQKLLATYRERFPNISFECVHLCRVFDVRTIDWTVLPVPLPPATAGEEGDFDNVRRLRAFFDSLPSVTSRADVMRLMIRHLLIHVATERSYSALLLGHNTTSLASLTLSEVANGRGFAVPWQVNDGFFTVCTYDQNPAEGQLAAETSRTEFPIYHPLREVLGAEVAIYIDLIPSLQGLVSPSLSFPASSTSGKVSSGSVVSHKDMSIEEVTARYFVGVEGPYSGIVANVVRTSGKLDRLTGSTFCRLCGITLDDEGDSVWAGELGDEPEQGSASGTSGKLCYGCKRSING